jgi:hypothetical protein
MKHAPIILTNEEKPTYTHKKLPEVELDSVTMLSPMDSQGMADIKQKDKSEIESELWNLQHSKGAYAT